MVNTLNVLGFPHTYELTPPTNSSTVLVFVHGWLLSKAYWQPLVQRLSASYQCLSYDMRGFGDSCSMAPASARTIAPAAVSVGAALEPAGISAREGVVSPGYGISGLSLSIATASRYTPAAYAQDLVLLLQQLKLSNVWLVGHSLGGSIALWAADQAPETIAGVICVNSGGGIYLKEEFDRFRSVGKQLVTFRPRWFSYVPFLDLMLTRFSVAQPIARRWGRQRLLDLLRAEPEAALGTLLESTTEAEVHLLPQVISRLRQPVHFIAGANDTIMEPQYVHHLASFHSSFESCGNNVSEIPNCGHLSMVEQPEAVVNEIEAVLAKHT
ncbi:alpha/beta hydrolase [Phormidium tenue FACHB-886]|nr:alpha/beta hydrolase [Phormidium tenue FACHB-886]